MGPRLKLLLIAIGTLLVVSYALVWSSQGFAAATQGPVAEYSFDENPGEGTTIKDDSGNGHIATIHGAKWTPHGRYGGAMEFDAEKGDYLSVPESTDLDLTEEFTLEAWVRPGSGENYWGPLIDKQIPGEEGLSEYAYFLYASDYEEDRPPAACPKAPTCTPPKARRSGSGRTSRSPTTGERSVSTSTASSSTKASARRPR